MLQTILIDVHTAIISFKHSLMVIITNLQATISTLKHSFMLYYSKHCWIARRSQVARSNQRETAQRCLTQANTTKTSPSPRAAGQRGERIPHLISIDHLALEA
jgi:hypothetical protein